MVERRAGRRAGVADGEAAAVTAADGAAEPEVSVTSGRGVVAVSDVSNAGATLGNAREAEERAVFVFVAVAVVGASSGELLPPFPTAPAAAAAVAVVARGLPPLVSDATGASSRVLGSAAGPVDLAIGAAGLALEGFRRQATRERVPAALSKQ